MPSLSMLKAYVYCYREWAKYMLSTQFCHTVICESHQLILVIFASRCYTSMHGLYAVMSVCVRVCVCVSVRPSRSSFVDSVETNKHILNFVYCQTPCQFFFRTKRHRNTPTKNGLGVVQTTPNPFFKVTLFFDAEYIIITVKDTAIVVMEDKQETNRKPHPRFQMAPV